jgi:hypothetical protein
MEDLIIPGWAVILMSGIGTLIIGWLIWLTLKTAENDKAIAVNTQADTFVRQELRKMDEKMDHLRTEFKEWIDKLELQMERRFDKVFNKLGI